MSTALDPANGEDVGASVGAEGTETEGAAGTEGMTSSAVSQACFFAFLAKGELVV